MEKYKVFEYKYVLFTLLIEYTVPNTSKLLSDTVNVVKRGDIFENVPLVRRDIEETKYRVIKPAPVDDYVLADGLTTFYNNHANDSGINIAKITIVSQQAIDVPVKVVKL